MQFLINHIFAGKHQTITPTTSNQRYDYKTAGDYKTARWLQHNQLRLCVRIVAVIAWNRVQLTNRSRRVNLKQEN